MGITCSDAAANDAILYNNDSKKLFWLFVSHYG